MVNDTNDYGYPDEALPYETADEPHTDPMEPVEGVVVDGAPTQVRKPWRTTARTAFQALVALCVLFPILVEQTGLTTEDFPWLAIPLGVAAAVARIMALPQVEDFLGRFIPFLAANGHRSQEDA